MKCTTRGFSKTMRMLARCQAVMQVSKFSVLVASVSYRITTFSRLFVIIAGKRRNSNSSALSLPASVHEIEESLKDLQYVILLTNVLLIEF